LQVGGQISGLPQQKQLREDGAGVSGQVGGNEERQDRSRNSDIFGHEAAGDEACRVVIDAGALIRLYGGIGKTVPHALTGRSALDAHRMLTCARPGINSSGQMFIVSHSGEHRPNDPSRAAPEIQKSGRQPR